MELEAILATTTTSTTPKPEGAKSSAASLPIVPVAAGAGGGIILIIIIVIVVIRRKRRTQPQDQRAVVAFENPMYDTNKNGGSQPLYDNKDTHEGLYDEPAFASKTEKTNPIYGDADGEFNDVAKALHSQALPDDYDEPAGVALTSQPIYGDDYLQTEQNTSHIVVEPAQPVYGDDYLQAEQVNTQPAQLGDDYLQTEQSVGIGFNQQPLYDNDVPEASDGGYLDVGAGQDNE